LGPATKIGPANQFLQFSHPKSTKIDDKLYNDPFRITHQGPQVDLEEIEEREIN